MRLRLLEDNDMDNMTLGEIVSGTTSEHRFDNILKNYDPQSDTFTEQFDEENIN